MSEDRIFRARIVNWSRYIRPSRAHSPTTMLSRYASSWQEERYREVPGEKVDVDDAQLLEKSFPWLDASDRKLLKDWYVNLYSIGKMSRVNHIFFRNVVLRVQAAERRFRDAVEAVSTRFDNCQKTGFNSPQENLNRGSV